MPDKHLISRRHALKITALSAAGLSLLGCAASSEAKRSHRLKLGLASYSMAKYPPDEVIAALNLLQLKYVSLHKAHCPWGGTPDECRAAAKKFTDAGLTITGTNVIDLPNNEAVLRKAFDNARAVGLPMMVCKPALDAFPLIEKFVKEYDIRLAIHNHGPEDKVYPSPYDAWKAVQPYDKRIGLCIDVGHAARGGVDPAEAIRKCHTRLYDIHLKDSTAPVGAPRDVPIEVGKGHLDIKGILAALIEVKYQHIVAFEYEKGGDVVTGLGVSVAFVRETLAALAG